MGATLAVALERGQLGRLPLNGGQLAIRPDFRGQPLGLPLRIYFKTLVNAGIAKIFGDGFVGNILDMGGLDGGVV